MGCASSIEGGAEARGGSSASATHHNLHTDPALRSAKSGEDANAAPVRLALFDALDRTLEEAMIESDGSEVDTGEPSSFMLSVQRKKICFVARMQYGITDDPHQFIPEHVPYDSTAAARVIEWFTINDATGNHLSASRIVGPPPPLPSSVSPRRATQNAGCATDDEATAGNETSSEDWIPRRGTRTGSGFEQSTTTTVPGSNPEAFGGLNGAPTTTTTTGGSLKLEMSQSQKADEHSEDGSLHSRDDDDTPYSESPKFKQAARSAVCVPPVATCHVGKRVIHVRLIEKIASGMRFPLQECTINAHNRLIDRAIENDAALSTRPSL